MTTLDLVFYSAAILPIAWLCWLALRTFAFHLNRVLFAVSGLLIYGFFMNAQLVPLTAVQSAHVLAQQELARMGAKSTLQATSGLSVQFIVYLGISLVLFALLTFWLQRSLSRSPKIARAAD